MTNLESTKMAVAIRTLNPAEAELLRAAVRDLARLEKRVEQLEATVQAQEARLAALE